MRKLDEDFKIPTESKIWNKKDFQEMLSDVKKQGMTVTKLDAGYTVHSGNVLLLKAMNGSQGYLSRQVKELFT